MNRRINIAPTTASPNTHTQWTGFILTYRPSWKARIRNAIAALRGQP